MTGGEDQSDSSNDAQTRQLKEGSSSQEQGKQGQASNQDGQQENHSDQKAQSSGKDQNNSSVSSKVSAKDDGSSKVEIKEVKIANDADLNARREEMRSVVKSTPGIPHAETSTLTETLTAAADNEVSLSLPLAAHASCHSGPALEPAASATPNTIS